MIDLSRDPSELQNRLHWLLTRRIAPATTLPEADFILTHFEANDKHGTGVLLRKIFGDCPEIFTIYTYAYYKHENYLGERSLALAHDSLSRPEIFAQVMQATKGTRPRRVVTVPFFKHEAWTAIALHEIHDVPVCTYVMDDRNIYDPHIPDDLMRNLLRRSALRLVISPEMREAYEAKFDMSFWVLPPVVSRRLLPAQVQYPPAERLCARTGVLVGNIKSQHSLNLLRRTTRGTGLTVHWYGDVERSLAFTEEELRADGIVYCGFIAQHKLAALLSSYAYAILPTSPLSEDVREIADESTTARAIARLSWPSRISFIMGTSHTPLLVLGNPATAAARAVRRLEIGGSANYEPRDFAAAVERLTAPEHQTAMRTRAFDLAERFAADGVADWIWRSMERGEPCDDRYETLPGM